MRVSLKLGPAYDGFAFLAETARNPPLLRSHHHVELELNLVVRGDITYVVNGRRFTFGPRTLLWMFPAQEHQLVNRSADARYWVAVFKPRLIAQACRARAYAGLKRRAPAGAGVVHAGLAPEPFDLLQRVLTSLMDGAPDADLLNREGGYGFDSDFRYEHADPDALNAGLRYLLLHAWRHQTAGGAAPAGPVALHPAVRTALEVLSEGREDGNLAALARRCGVSETYLSRIFARQVGVPLSHYRNSVRLARFWELRRGRTQRTLSEAAYAAGFGSYAQFYKVYAATYGEGPRASLGGP